MELQKLCLGKSSFAIRLHYVAADTLNRSTEALKKGLFKFIDSACLIFFIFRAKSDAMKLAYLLLVHNNPGQLQRLIKKLSTLQTDFYIHVDQKADISVFTKLVNLPNVFFIKKRETVRWGGYSIIRATVNGFEEIVASGNDYAYITLLSGQDYPLKSNETIRQFFTRNPGKAFMLFESVKEQWIEAQPRLNRYFLTDHSFPGSTMLEGWINKLLPARKPPADLEFVGRSQWFSITIHHVKYIVDKLRDDKRLHKYFKYTWGSDEFVFQTLLYNSSFRNDMVNDNLRYTDWSQGGASPKVLKIADIDAITRSGALFARKFDATVDPDVLDRLDALTV